MVCDTPASSSALASCQTWFCMPPTGSYATGQLPARKKCGASRSTEMGLVTVAYPHRQSPDPAHIRQGTAISAKTRFGSFPPARKGRYYHPMLLTCAMGEERT